MARRKRIQTEEGNGIEMNISSLIDCVFLLLIYFIVATSLVSEKKLDISIPGSESSGGEPPPVEPINIRVSADGSVYSNDMQVGDPYNAEAKSGTPEYRNQRRMDGLIDALVELKNLADSAGTTPIVVMKGSPQAPHQRIVDVMASLAEADIHTVGLNTSEE